MNLCEWHSKIEKSHKSHGFMTFMTILIQTSHKSHRTMTFVQKQHLKLSGDLVDYT